MVWRLVLGVSLVVMASGCNDSDDKDIKVYRTVNDTSAPPAEAQAAQPAAPADQEQPALPPGHPDMPKAQPHLTWTLPPGWQEAGPGQMSLVTFNITGDAGAQADVAVTPLPGLTGKEAAIVNMWRQQVGLPELSDDEALKQLTPVKIGDADGKMFEVTGKSGNGAPKKIVTAIMPRGEVSWFYKLQGDAALVDAQKPAFVEFLKSVKIEDAPASETASAPGGLPPMGASGPDVAAAPGPQHWSVPPDWKALAPGAMQVAKFALPDQNGAKADVTVSTFPSATGGTLANVNRWRRQLGLAAITDADLPTAVTALDAQLPDAVLVDLSNNNRRLIGAIVPREGQWYFYKLLGDAGAVGPQKDAFIAFAKLQP
jgi:hypothetical protein